MSGLEVAGLVLGVLPIAVKALHSYRSILSSVKNLNHDILALVQDIETEGVRLRTNCELLLDDIVPFHKIDALLEDPLSPAWKEFDVDYKLRIRLYDSYPKFEEKIRDIQEASSVLKHRLCIEEDGRIPYTDKKSISRALKKTAFALNRKDYEDIISRMKSANTFLNNLAVNCRMLDTSRKRRSHNRVVQLLHSLTKSLFKALQSAATGCHCPRPHDAYLELVARKIVLVPQVTPEDMFAREIDFHIVLTSVKNSGAAADRQTSLDLRLQQRWTSFELRYGGSLPPALPMVTSGVSLSTSSSMTLVQPTENMNSTEAFGKKTSTKITTSTSSRWSRTASGFTSLLTGQSRRKVAFAPASSTETVLRDSPSTSASFPLPLVVGPSHTNTAPTMNKPQPLLDLCQVTLSTVKSQAHGKGHYGYISDSSEGRKFELQPLHWGGQIHPQTQTHHTASEFNTSLTLREILESNAKHSAKGYPDLDVHTKLSMAYHISANVLHLHSTPWLSGIVTLDDIVFLVDKQSTTFKLRPFVTKQLAQKESNKQPDDSDSSSFADAKETEECFISTHRPMDLSSFSFGLLLIQLIIGRVDDAIDMTTAASHSRSAKPPGQPTSISTPPRGNQGQASTLQLSKILDLHYHAGEFQDELCQYAGANVVDVVNWCRQSYRDLRGLENEEFRQNFQYEVVERLEKDLKNVPAPPEGKCGIMFSFIKVEKGE